jgi:tetratricopeptide (TPR) repeat protein
MKNLRYVLAVSQISLSFIALQSGTAEGLRITQDERYVDFKLFQNVSSNAVNWLSYASKCDEGIDRMLIESKDEVSSHFIAAKLSWLAGKPSRAVAILEKVIHNKGQSKAPGFQMPVAILGNLWIGTICRHFGDAERAEKAYDDIVRSVEHDEKLRSNTAICYLYQAEIESSILGKKEAALKTLQCIGSITRQYNTEEWKVFQEWADYQVAVLGKGAKQARNDLKGSYRKMQACAMLPITQLAVIGVLGEPRSDFYDDSRKVIGDAALHLVVDCRTSPIDRSLAQFLLGYTSEQSKNMEKAEMHYGDLFSGESFFAPEGGIFLAQCQKKQGKVDEANKTFAKVKQVFPGYQEFVDELTK